MSRADAGRARGDGWGGMIDAAWLSGTRTKEDSRSMGLITATRDAHIIVIFIKHRSYIFAGERAIMYLAWKTFDEILVVFDCVDIYLRTEREREREKSQSFPSSMDLTQDPRDDRYSFTIFLGIRRAKWGDLAHRVVLIGTSRTTSRQRREIGALLIVRRVVNSARIEDKRCGQVIVKEELDEEFHS